MKKLFFSFLLLLSIGVNAQTETFHDFIGISILGDTINFSDYAGKKVLVVNTASFCSYTPQFADLAALDSIYSGPGFAIIGFPCNDFGGQDPNSDSAINNFCAGNYNVAFQMMHKISITAPDTAEVYKWLQLMSRNGVQDAPVTWNFHKFCIDELGHWVHHFPSTTNPLDTAITNWINSPAAMGVQEYKNNAEILLLENPVGEKISFSVRVTQPEFLTLELFDARGASAGIFFNSKMESSQMINRTTNDLQQGVYYARIKGDRTNQVIRVLYLK
jgi:glutathione peroxidase